MKFLDNLKELYLIILDRESYHDISTQFDTTIPDHLNPIAHGPFIPCGPLYIYFYPILNIVSGSHGKDGSLG